MKPLQWGRATGGAEIAELRAVCRVDGTLQWGRATGGAEIADSGGQALPVFGAFNGAAPRGARKLRYAGEGASAKGGALQWGRATGGAEIRRQ